MAEDPIKPANGSGPGEPAPTAPTPATPPPPASMAVAATPTAPVGNRSIKDRIVDVFEKDRATGKELAEALIAYGRVEAEQARLEARFEDERDANRQEALHRLETQRIREQIALQDAIGKREIQFAVAQRDLLVHAQPHAQMEHPSARLMKEAPTTPEQFQLLRLVLGAGLLCIAAGAFLGWIAAPAVATLLTIATGGLCLSVASVASVPAGRHVGTEIAPIWEAMTKFVRATGEAMAGKVARGTAPAPKGKRFADPNGGDKRRGKAHHDEEAELELLAEEEAAKDGQREERED